MKLLSIITVVYNDVSHIEETIKSVLNQPLEKTMLEYIIIDGKSTDGTVDVIHKYQNMIDIFISEPDTGIYNAMNKGVRLASGRWCQFLNSGDVLVPDAYRIFDFCINNNTGILFGNTIRSFTKCFIKQRFQYKEGVLPPVCHQSAFIRSDIMKEYLYDEKYQICADLDLFKKIYDSGFKFQYVDIDISKYNMYGFSARNMVKFAEEKRRIGFYISKLEFLKFRLKAFVFRISPKLYNWLLYMSIKHEADKKDIIYKTS